MKMQSGAVRRLAQFVTLATVLALAAGTAHAARKSVEFWPGDFQAALPAEGYTQTNRVLASRFEDNTSGGGVTFWAQLKLPVRSRILGVELIYATDASPAPLFNGEIWRDRLGLSPEQLMSVGGSTVTGGVVTTTGSTTPIDPDPRKLVIAPGYRYHVEVYSHNKSTRIHGFRVHYATP